MRCLLFFSVNTLILWYSGSPSLLYPAFHPAHSGCLFVVWSRLVGGTSDQQHQSVALVCICFSLVHLGLLCQGGAVFTRKSCVCFIAFTPRHFNWKAGINGIILNLFLIVNILKKYTLLLYLYPVLLYLLIYYSSYLGNFCC